MACFAIEFNEYCKIIKQRKSPGKKPEATLLLKPEHIAEKRTIPRMPWADGDDYLIRIDHSKENPDDAFVAVRYRNYWFYIDDKDLKSKRTFTFMMILFSVTETGGREGLPLVTIPVG